MSINRIASIRNPDGLDLSLVKSAAPAAFAKKPSPKVSEKYTFISTIDALTPLLDTGWKVTAAGQRATRLDGRDPKFTRHAISLAPPAVKGLKKVGDVRPELSFINSHDRQSKGRLYAGFVRLACLNGLTVSAIDFGGFVFVHRGEAVNILEQANNALTGLKEAASVIQVMEKTKMSSGKQKLFAARAAELAYDRKDFDPTALLATRRVEDDGDTVWQVYNRVQENVVRGGVRLTHSTGARAETVTRGISHIQRTTDFNLALWQLAADQVRAAA
jgi:hydrogenase maturation factor